MKPQTFNKPQAVGSAFNSRSPIVQRQEQRSIAIHDEPLMLPAHTIDVRNYSKTDDERAELANARRIFLSSTVYSEEYGPNIDHRIFVSKQKNTKREVLGLPKPTSSRAWRKRNKIAIKNINWN